MHLGINVAVYCANLVKRYHRMNNPQQVRNMPCGEQTEENAVGDANGLWKDLKEMHEFHICWCQ